MLSADVSNSNTDLIDTSTSWSYKPYQYHILNEYGYGTKRRYPESSKMFYQKSSIMRDNNGEYTIINAVEEIDFHSSVDSITHTDKATNQNSLNQNSLILKKMNSQEDQVKRSSAGKEEPHLSKSCEKDNLDNDVKSLASAKISHVPQSIEQPHVEVPKTQKPKCTKVSASKRQKLMIKEYQKLSRSLSFLVKSQKHIPLKKKAERNCRKELLGRVRRSLKTLGRKLRKREKLYQFEVKERLQKEHRKRIRHRVKKILRVVYSKRKQRIRSMRNLRIQERKRIADNLMLKAAKLRSRANRLTAGRESRFLHRQVQLPKKPGDPLKTMKSWQTSTAPIKVLAESTEIAVNNKIVEKKTCEKKKHKKKLTKMEKQKKKLDYEVKIMGTVVRRLLNEFSGFCKAPARRKAKKILAQIAKSQNPNDVNTERMKGGALSKREEIGKQKPSKTKGKKDKNKKKRRHLREAWWRKDKLKAAKNTPKESPKIDDFGSDTDIYDLNICDNKRLTPRPPQVTAVKSFS